MQEMNIWEYVTNRHEDDLLVDIREKTMYEFGTVPGAINIPIDNIRQLYRLPKDRDIYVFCQTGIISVEITELLADAGYHACNLAGGYREYLRRQLAEQAKPTNET